MRGNLFCFLFCCFLYLYIGQEENRIINLTAEFPSYAIHGLILQDLQEITINGCDGCDFLVDFSLVDCFEMQNKAWNRFDEIEDQSQNDVTQRVLCHDLLPLSINGQEPKRSRKQRALPYSTEFDVLLFYDLFEINNHSKLVIGVVETTLTSDDWAVSVRVKQWIDESWDMVVVPSDPESILATNMLVRQGVMATIVLNPYLYDDPLPILQVRVVQVDLELHSIGRFCELYQPDITCNLDNSYSAYAGGTPGRLHPNLTYLNEFGVNTWMASRSTVFTIFTKSSCNFCFTTVSDDAQMHASLEDEITLNSFGYPWIFDNAHDYPDCFEYQRQFKQEDRTEIFLEVRVLFGGSLLFVSYPEINDQCDYDSDPTNNLRFTQPQVDLIKYQTRCLGVDWCPDSEEDPFGFLIQIHPSPITDPYRLGCMQTVELTEQDPIAIFTDTIGDRWRSTVVPLCLKLIGPVKNYHVLVDFVTYCKARSNITGQVCSETLPYELNGIHPPFENCTRNYSSINRAIVERCSLIFEQNSSDLIYLRSPLALCVDIMACLFKNSSISLRALEWIDLDAYDFSLQSIYEVGNVVSAFLEGGLSYRFPGSPRPTWMALPIYQSAQYRTSLDKFRWDRPDIACHYELISGPPPGKFSHPERHLITFNDTQPFIEQLLESSLYSVLIPAGCHPSIRIFSTVANDYSKVDPTYNYDDEQLYNKSQNLCSGMTIVESRGYMNPFETPNVDLFDEYYLTHRLICVSFPIDIVVEIMSLGNGKILLEFLDYQRFDIKKRINLNSRDKLPMKYRERESGGLLISWNSTKQDVLSMKGCFIRVSASPSLSIDPFPQNITTTTKLPKLSPTFGFHFALLVSLIVIL